VFSDLHGMPGGAPIVLCGTSGNYLLEGFETRESDYYRLLVTEENTITFDCAAEFPVTTLLIDAAGGCAAPEVLAFDNADPNPDHAVFTYTCPPGEYWYWIGPSVFSGVDCGALYVFTVEGYTSEPIPVTPTTWGGVKALYR
jgi:hypothetical protein